MAEQSHRDEMNAAIRAQRERHAAPRTISAVNDPAPAAPASAELPQDPARELPQHAEPPRKSMLDRLRGR